MMYKNDKREVYVSHIWSYMLSGETWTSRYTEPAILFLRIIFYAIRDINTTRHLEI